MLIVRFDQQPIRTIHDLAIYFVVVAFGRLEGASTQVLDAIL